MKALKIIIAIVVLVAISVGVYFLIGAPKILPPPPQPSKNQFIDRIEHETDSLKKLSNSKFCPEFYKDIAYQIDDFYKNNRFSNKQSENAQWRDNLSRSLYSAYTEKFISQVDYVFNGSDWNIPDLQFIRNEYQSLQKSPLLERGSYVDNSFNQIQQVFSKYDEINGFISSCKNFSYPTTNSLFDKYPIEEAKSKIARARAYLNNGLENTYVKNCTRLQDGLKGIPQMFFDKHVRYLNNKLKHWSGWYKNCPTQINYANVLYKPLKTEIDALDKSIYDVANFDSEYNRLLSQLNADSQDAYNYFNNKSQN